MNNTNLEGGILVSAKELLFELISCDTTDTKEINGLLVIERELDNIGIPFRRIHIDAERLSRLYPEFNSGRDYQNRYCIEAILKGERGGQSLLLNAHIDTVTPAKSELWETNPFDAVEKNGLVYGLGSCDTKAGLGAILMALKFIKENKIRLKGDLIVHFVIDEEVGGGNGTLACVDSGRKADAVIVFEPTDLYPAVAHVGSYATSIRVQGKGAHGNLKNEGVNAIEESIKLASCLLNLGDKWRKQHHPVLPSPLVSILSIHSGDGSITIPSECEFLLNYTYLPENYPYEQEMIETVLLFERQNSWYLENPIKLLKQHDVKPYSCFQKSRIAQTIIKAVFETTGNTLEPIGLGCGSDARFYANLLNVDTIVFGPGSILDAHRPNEHVELRQYYQVIEILISTIMSWCEAII